MKKINSVPIEPYFLAYKTDPNDYNLEMLFGCLDSVITEVLKNISKTFRQKHREDFEDLLQTTKMDIFVYLPKICKMSLDAEQLIRIIVSASVFRFKAAYRTFKTKNPVVFHDYNRTNSSWTPDNKVPIFYSLSHLEQKTHFEYKITSIKENSHPFLHLFYSSFDNDSNDDEGSRALLSKVTRVMPTQELNLYINTFKKRLYAKVCELNRYKDLESAILLCVERILNKSQPSKKMFKHVFDVHSNFNFIVSYAEILLKISISSILKEDRGNLFFDAQ